MKAILLFALAVLLCGCSEPAQPTETTQPTIQTTEATQPAEKLITGESGQFRYYDAPGGVAAIAPMADGWALLTCDGTALLLRADELEVVKERTLGCSLLPDDPTVLICDDQISYFDRERGAYVTLGKNLTELSAITLRHTLTAEPLLSSDRKQLYYGTDDGLRLLDIATGNSRLLRQEHNRVVSLDALLFDGSILRYTYETEDGARKVRFIRTADGTSVYLAELNGEIVTWSQRYAAVMLLEQPMGLERRIVTGTVTGPVQELQVGDSWDSVLFAGGCALVQTLEEEQLSLTLYDMETGCLRAQTRLEADAPFTGAAHAPGGLWLWHSDSSRFYFWTPQSETQGAYLQPLDTLASEDEAGMQQVRDYMARLGKAYGITLRLVEQNNRTGGVDYSGYPDCRVSQYMQALQLLEQTMSVLPYNITTTLGREHHLAVELVDDFDPALGVRPGTGSLTIGKETVLQVSICGELPQIFYHELFHAMDLQIHGITDKLTQWDDANPEGFVYSGSYAAWQQGQLEESPYADAFPDSYARISAREDRAQTFMYAMLEGEGARFESEAMQKKLQILDEAIRVSFGYRQSTDTFRWQQYLK